MAKLLEVIVTSLDEAREAVAGGADRLELVRNLEQGGLTPPLKIVEAVIAAVDIPVRLMVRENDGVNVRNDDEVETLERQAEAFSQLPAGGLVTGFVADGEVNDSALTRLSAAAPKLPITFHRAFEDLRSPEHSLARLKEFRQVDRILVRVGAPFLMTSLLRLQTQADPQIKIIVGIGLAKHYLDELRGYESLSEVHVGRAVREPEVAAGKLTRQKVAALRKALA